MQQKFITVTFNRAKIALRCADILYVIMSDDHCTIHMFDGSVYRCRITLKELKKQLDEGFMEVKRGCMIAVSAISDIGDKILLSNGEEICYTKRKKKALREELQKKQELMIAKISKKKLGILLQVGKRILQDFIHAFIQILKSQFTDKVQIWRLVTFRLNIICNIYNFFQQGHIRFSCGMPSDRRKDLLVSHPVLCFCHIGSQLCMEQKGVGLFEFSYRNLVLTAHF